MKKRWKRNLSLYQKFCLVIITLGLIPMLFLSTVIVNRMFKEYGNSLRSNYVQAASYVSVDNLFTLTDYEGYNPEVDYKGNNLLPGFDWGVYPLARTYSIGAKITF